MCAEYRDRACVCQGGTLNKSSQDDDNQECRSKMLSQSRKKRKSQVPNPTPCQKKSTRYYHWTATSVALDWLSWMNKERPQSSTAQGDLVLESTSNCCDVLFSLALFLS